MFFGKSLSGWCQVSEKIKKIQFFAGVNGVVREAMVCDRLLRVDMVTQYLSISFQLSIF
jgi:hypothetical protein